MKPENVSRRDLLRLAASGVVMSGAAGTSSWFLPHLAAADPKVRPKACIVLFMHGGASQHHTFHLPAEGDYRGAPTAVPGITISEHLPKLAASMKDLAILCSMSTGNSVHERARVLMHTGFNPNVSVQYASVGNLASDQLGQARAEMPSFVNISAGQDGLGSGPIHVSNPSYVGPAHAPVNVADPDRGLEFLKPADGLESLQQAASLLDRFEQRFQKSNPAGAIGTHRASYQRALTLLNSPKARAFDLTQEPSASRDAYGTSKFGRACLLARRLVEVGVPFVEVTLDGWDDHGGAPRNVQRRSAYLDPVMSHLIADLKERGLLDSTLVVWMSEFGRTPRLGTGYNQGLGAGHYAKAWSTVLAGAGLKTGQKVGKTDAKGGEVTETPVSAQDFLATIFRALGLDGHKVYQARDGRPMQFLEPGAKPIEQLF